MIIELIQKNTEDKVAEEFLGRVVLLDDDAYLISRISYSECFIISLTTGFRLNDESFPFDELNERNLYDYFIKSGVSKIQFVDRSQCKLTINV